MSAETFCEYCAPSTPAPNNCFTSLLRRMTQSCVPLLLLLAGSAAVSCGARAAYDSLPMSGAGGVSAAGGSAATGGEASLATGGNLGFALPPGTGGSPVINTSGTVPCVEDSDGGAGAPLSMSDVQNIVKQCIVESTTRDDVLACLDTLNTSWQQSVEWLLNCSNCDDVASFLLLLMARCSQLPDQYDRCFLDPRFCMPIYAGVRLD